MPKKNLLLDVQRKLEVVNDEEYRLDRQVPAIVQAWGITVGVPAEERELLGGMYGGLALRVARLLETCGVQEVPEDVTESVSKRWAAMVNPWVAIGARVDALHQAYREAPEDVPAAAAKLWAVLDFRCQAITGVKLERIVL